MSEKYPIRYFVIDKDDLCKYGHEDGDDTLAAAIRGIDGTDLSDMGSLVVIKGVVLPYTPTFRDVPLTRGDKHE